MTNSQAPSRSAGRTLDLFEFVLTEGETNLTAAAAAADLTPTTALRHLKSLIARGYVHRDSLGIFSAGPTFLRLAAAALESGPRAHLIAVALPHLQTLSEQTGESAYLAVRDDDHAVYLAMRESTRAIRHTGWLGRQLPLEGSAVGEALLGERGVRVRMGAVEPDITAAAVGVHAGTGVVAALSVVGPSHRMGEPQLTETIELLGGEAGRLARQLGAETEATP